MAEKTTEEILREKIHRAIETLERRKISAEEDAKGYAVRLTELFREKSENSKELKNKFYLDYQIAKTAGVTFDAAITQLRWTL